MRTPICFVLALLLLLPGCAMLRGKADVDPDLLAVKADALRRANQPQEALEVLKPVVKEHNAQTMPGSVFISYIKLLLAENFPQDAEVRLRARMSLPQSKQIAPASAPQLQNLLGVALAAQGKDKEAQQAFEAAQKGWDGRQGVVEANLAKLQEKP